jgi:hypothetical protein
MTDWLFQNRSSIYLLLGTAAVIAAAVWWRTRKRRDAVVFGAVLALVVAFVLVDQVFRGETDQEQIERLVRELAASVTGPAVEKEFATRVAADFVSPRGNKNEAFCKAAADHARTHRVKEVAVWEFDFQDVSRSSKTARVRFQFKIKAERFDAPGACLATFRLDPDDRWRLLGFKVFFPANSLDEWPSPL